MMTSYYIMYTAILSVLYLVQNTIAVDSLKVAFQWKQINFEYPNMQARLDAINSRQFSPENNIPVGLEVYGDRIFITLPRWKEGVAASLAYIKRTDRQDSPLLRPYPNWEAHDQNVPEPTIVSPFRIRADNCGRLWVLDTGNINLLDNDTFRQVTPPKVLIYDLKTDQLMRTYKIPDEQISKNNNSFFANIAVEENNCDDSFAYLADLGNPSLVVYDFKQNGSWMVKHQYFNFHPLAGRMSVAGINFTWSDGVFGLSLSEKDSEGFSTLYFHPMTSFNEFTVSTKVLRNKELATNSTNSFHEFKLLGTRGTKSQSGASFLHKKSGVLFYSLVHLNAVACWRTSLPNYSMESQGRVTLSEDLLTFPNDIKVDVNDTLWVLSDKLPLFMYSHLLPYQYNFKILNSTVKDAIKGTPCDSKMKIDIHVMKNITNAKRPSSSIVIQPLFYVFVLCFVSVIATR